MNFKDANIIYMGTPTISATTFEDLIKAGVHFIALIAQEDKEVGRKKIKEVVPTKVVANKYHIPVYQPHKIKDDYNFIKELKPDLILTFAYGQIIPEELLNIPSKGCVNLHGSLLPKYRGAAPIQRAIMNGEKVTGITLMKMVKEMDAGEMYTKEEVEILPTDNYSTLSNKLSKAATKVVLTNLDKLLSGTLVGVKQNENEVTFANKILPNEEHLDLELDAIKQINYIHALAMSPGAYLYLNDEKLKIYDATILNDKVNYQLGEIVVVNNDLCYQGPNGIIKLITVQPQGKNIMSANDYLNGHKDLAGKVFK